MYEYIPAYTLALADTVDIDPQGITFLMPYAAGRYFHYLERGDVGWGYTIHRSIEAHREHRNTYMFTPAEHPKASEHWDEAALKNHLDDIIDELKRFIEARA